MRTLSTIEQLDELIAAVPGFGPFTSRTPKDGYIWHDDLKAFRESDHLYRERFRVAHGLVAED